MTPSFRRGEQVYVDSSSAPLTASPPPTSNVPTAELCRLFTVRAYSNFSHKGMHGFIGIFNKQSGIKDSRFIASDLTAELFQLSFENPYRSAWGKRSKWGEKKESPQYLGSHFNSISWLQSFWLLGTRISLKNVHSLRA